MAAAADLRDRMARHDAALWYVAQHERFAELEQMLLLVGSEDEAAIAHGYALMLLRAHLAEIDDLEPVARATTPCCAGCMVYLALPAVAKRIPRMERGR